MEKKKKKKKKAKKMRCDEGRFTTQGLYGLGVESAKTFGVCLLQN